MKRYIARITVVVPKDEVEHPEIDQFTHVSTSQFPIDGDNIDTTYNLVTWLNSISRRISGPWGAFIEVYPDKPHLERFGKMFALEYDSDDSDNFWDLVDKVTTAVRLIESRLK